MRFVDLPPERLEGVIVEITKEKEKLIEKLEVVDVDEIVIS